MVTAACSLNKLLPSSVIPARGPTIKLVKYLGQFLCPQPSGMGRLLDQVRLYRYHKHQPARTVYRKPLTPHITSQLNLNRERNQKLKGR